jgi:hypothetical protein
LLTVISGYSDLLGVPARPAALSRDAEIRKLPIEPPRLPVSCSLQPETGSFAGVGSDRTVVNMDNLLSG